MQQASVGVHCPECTKSNPQRSYSPANLPGSQGIVTTVLVAINALVWVAMIALGKATPSGAGSSFVEYGTFGPAIDRLDEFWRLVTGGFLHAGVIHIGFNMYLLWQLGKQLEKVVGEANFVVMYFAALLGGSFGAMLLNAGGAHGGASGAVFGLFGVTAILYRERGINVMQTPLGRLIALNLIITFAVPGISKGGHLGGFVAGLIIGVIYFGVGKRSGSPFGDNKWAPAIATAVLGVLFFLAGIWAAGANLI